MKLILMKKILTSALLISLLAISCKNEETATSIATDETSVTSETSIQNTEVAPQVPTQNPAESMLAVPNNATTTSNSAPVAAGINPAHGQPGHRCEIPVGAPLNSVPAQGKTVTQTPQAAPIMGGATTTTVSSNDMKNGVVKTNGATITTTQNNGEKTVTPAGMNPPHGEAGHTCSVPVGAPLPITN